MAAKEKHPIPTSDFIQKRYEISKDLLASAIRMGGVDMTNIESRQSDSIVYNCTQMADLLLKELGYYKADRSLLPNDKSIPLQELLKNAKD